MSLTLCDLMEYILPGSSLHWIFQARIVEQVAISFSKGSPLPRDWTLVSCNWQEYSSQLSHLGNLVVKDLTCQSRRHKRCEFDPSVGKIPGGGHGNPFQYSCLENPMDEEPGRLPSMGLQRVKHTWSNLAYTEFSKVESFLEQPPQ